MKCTGSRSISSPWSLLFQAITIITYVFGEVTVHRWACCGGSPAEGRHCSSLSLPWVEAVQLLLRAPEPEFVEFGFTTLAGFTVAFALGFGFSRCFSKKPSEAFRNGLPLLSHPSPWHAGKKSWDIFLEDGIGKKIAVKSRWKKVSFYTQGRLVVAI